MASSARADVRDDGATLFGTDRLAIRRLTPDDAAFILELVNDADWLRFIGDKNVHSLADARRYLDDGPLAMYACVGFGLFMVELKGERTPIGICGLLKRDTLVDVDLGFAFLPAWRGRGYAREAARATLDYGARVLVLRSVVAITLPGNRPSIELLQSLGFAFRESIEPAGGGETLSLFVLDL